MITKEQTKAALGIVIDILREIEKAGASGIPCGVLYAGLLGQVTLQGYAALERTIINTGLVAKRHHCLYWVGVKQ